MKKSKKYWKKEADRLFSLWIRQSNADDNGICYCCTCGTPREWRYLDCGHFMPRDKALTRYKEKNCHPQCKKCNNKNWNQGEQYKHGKYIDKKYGEGTAEKLEMISGMECKRSWFDYHYIAQEYKQKLKDKGYEIR